MTKGSKLIRPNAPAKQPNPFELIIEKARGFRDSAISCTDPEEAQSHVRGIDSLLKETSLLQSEIGGVRKEASQHVAGLRRGKPKGKPAEGSSRTVNGVTYIFSSGKFYPVAAGEANASPAPPEE